MHNLLVYAQPKEIYIALFYLLEISSTSKSIESESRLVAQGWGGGGKWGVTANEQAFPYGVMEMV